MVRVPQIADVKTAYDIYMRYMQLGNKEIKALFGGHIGYAKISGLKQMAMDEMLKRGTPVWNVTLVDTSVAYEAWGIDVKTLSARYKKLKELEVIE